MTVLPRSVKQETSTFYPQYSFYDQLWNCIYFEDYTKKEDQQSWDYYDDIADKKAVHGDEDYSYEDYEAYLDYMAGEGPSNRSDTNNSNPGMDWEFGISGGPPKQSNDEVSGKILIHQE